MAALVTPQQFLEDFPEFGYKQGQYPVGRIQFWLNLAYLRLPACVWNELLNAGVELYVAHNLVLEKQASDAGKKGGSPGQATGPINSKSVDKVSVGYDTASASIDGAGNYNLTTFGTRFYELVMIVGTTAITINGGTEGAGFILTPIPPGGFY